ncbi:MAG: hypothetical protein ACRDUB_23935, partial [Mycobacterium sp.]
EVDVTNRGIYRWARARLAPAALLLFVGCSDSSSTPPPAPRDVTPIDAATAGSIQVQVSYNGAVPAPKEINMGGTPACAQLHPDPVYEQTLQVANGQLANAVVYIKSGFGSRTFAPPGAPVVIDQQGCLYHPHVSAVMIGQPLQFRNSDQEPHNVHGRPQTVDGWNFLMSRPNSTRDVFFDKTEVGIPVGCDVHPWMRAYVSVIDNPFFAVTPASGAVTLQTVPPGDYVVAVWHETLGTLVKPVTVPPSGTAALEFAFQKAES